MAKELSTKERKAIAREYKESYRPTGVFRLRNTRNGRILVGKSVNLPATFNRLRMTLDAGGELLHPELQRDWKEHGSAAFEFEVLQELEPPEGPGWDPRDDLAALEALWLEELSPYGDKGYNRRPKS